MRWDLPAQGQIHSCGLGLHLGLGLPVMSDVCHQHWAGGARTRSYVASGAFGAS